MDTRSHQADLIALSKLYWLVQTNDPNEQSLVTKVLDESSSFFLRKLLDAATDKIYENITKKVEQPEDHLETLNKSCTSPPIRTPHKEALEEKASELEHQKVIDALERIESFIPKLERLYEPYSNSLVSSSASSNEKTTLTTATKRCGDDVKSSSVTQFGTSQSRITSHSSFDSFFYHADDELSPSEYYQSRQRSRKKMGNLGRSNEKSGSIVHHHHHHHHHGEHPRDKNAEASRSLWKKYGKMFKSNEKKVEVKLEKKYMGNKKVEAKVQKCPEIIQGKHERRNKQQSGNFQELCRLPKNSRDKLQQRRKGLRLRKKLLVLF